MRKYIFLALMIVGLLLSTGSADLQTAAPSVQTAQGGLPEGDLDLNQIVVTFVRDSLGPITSSGIIGFVLMRLAPFLLDITKGIAMAGAKANSDLMELLQQLVSELKDTTDAIKVTLDNGVRVQDNLLDYLKTSSAIWDAKLSAIQTQLDLITRRLDEWERKDKKEDI